MGRKPRIHFPGAFFHAIARGNDKEAIFLEDADRRRFLSLLTEGVERFGHRIHSYCLMGNHAHLAVEVAEVPLSVIAHNLLFRYSSWFLRKYGRSGHLFERRYRAHLVESDAHLQRLVRYIHLNPVRAGLAPDTAAYAWSSHKAYLNMHALPPWLTTGFVLGLFGESPSGALLSYKEFVGAAETPETAEPAHREEGTLLAELTERRIVTARRKAVSIRQILDAVVSAMSIRPAEIRSDRRFRRSTRARGLAALFVQREINLTLVELGRSVGRDPTTLSRAAGRIARRRVKDESLRVQIEKIEELLESLPGVHDAQRRL